MKTYLIIAGVNGPGKSTLFESGKYFPEGTRENRVNADEELKSINGDSNNKVDQLKGGKIAVKKMKGFISSGKSFHQETTLSGLTDIQRIRDAKDSGYKIMINYIALENSNLARQRVANRVKLGGHDIPDEDIERRFKKSLENLKKAAPLADVIHIFDNSSNTMQEIYFRDGDEVVIDDLSRYPWISLD
ncbi:MAG: zeta toxin family protein [Lactobacillaceae bacterium]|jgi:predicted ABC-type ATPase|nr:zeta toxin family protein [Lactobacillaceae bacterium]